MVNVFLLLGSNLGDRFVYLKQAIANISVAIAPPSIVSSIYETAAWGKTSEPDYLNQVLMIKTAMPANEILERILNIEAQMGRQRTERWGSRTLDIDILFYGDAIINEAQLVVPHPQLQNRRFTLAPLAEIAPGLIHPVLKKDMVELKNELTDCLDVKKL